jgi:hypothetical protein
MPASHLQICEEFLVRFITLSRAAEAVPIARDMAQVRVHLCSSNSVYGSIEVLPLR